MGYSKILSSAEDGRSTLTSDKHKWKISCDEYGLAFSDGWIRDGIVIYNNSSWACDFPERLPQYIKKAMYSLLKKYGKENIEEFSKMVQNSL